MEEAAALAAELLGVTYDIALQETAIQRGGYFGQQWLYHCYQRNVHLYQRYDCAARAYMLMLVGCTIFADKSYTRVDAKWLPMFRNLETLHTFSWASAALVCLYDNLNDASMFSTKALAGYATLLQVTFIFWYCICYLNMNIFRRERKCLECNYYVFNL
jgi:hypothetical protein